MQCRAQRYFGTEDGLMSTADEWLLLAGAGGPTGSQPQPGQPLSFGRWRVPRSAFTNQRGAEGGWQQVTEEEPRKASKAHRDTLECRAERPAFRSGHAVACKLCVTAPRFRRRRTGVQRATCRDLVYGDAWAVAGDRRRRSGGGICTGLRWSPGFPGLSLEVPARPVRVRIVSTAVLSCRGVCVCLLDGLAMPPRP